MCERYATTCRLLFKISTFVSSWFYWLPLHWGLSSLEISQCVWIQGCSGAISSCCPKQTGVVTTTRELQYLSLSAPGKEAIWLWRLHYSTFKEYTNAVVVSIADPSVFKPASWEATNNGNNPNDITVHIRRAVVQNNVTVEHDPTKQMKTDLRTKPFGCVVFERLVKLTGINIKDGVWIYLIKVKCWWILYFQSLNIITSYQLHFCCY